MSNRISIEAQLKEASQLIEIEYKASSAPGANDGYLKLWLNDTLVDTLSGMDNDTRLVNNASLGAVASLDAGTSGTIYFDAFESRRGSHIGPLAYNIPDDTPVKALQPKDSALFLPVSYHPAIVLPDMPLLQVPTSLTIDYTYDALNRLTSATYNDGRSFGYTYDPAGNVLQLEQNLGPGTVTTTYTYNTANELVTAQLNGTTWNYTYDANGSLTEVLPNGNPGTGAKRYTYDVTGNLVQVEAHNGAGWNTQAEMNYNGLGQRLSMDAAGVIAHYVMDGDRPLSAESAGNTTFYLYGLAMENDTKVAALSI